MNPTPRSSRSSLIIRVAIPARHSGTVYISSGMPRPAQIPGRGLLPRRTNRQQRSGPAVGHRSASQARNCRGGQHWPRNTPPATRSAAQRLDRQWPMSRQSAMRRRVSTAGHARRGRDRRHCPCLSPSFRDRAHCLRKRRAMIAHRRGPAWMVATALCRGVGIGDRIIGGVSRVG